MSKIKIGESERDLSEVNESWITHQVREREQNGESVCVQVKLKDDGVEMILSTPQCGCGGGGGRLPNEKEKSIFELWNTRHLNQHKWEVGNLIAFLKQLHRLI